MPVELERPGGNLVKIFIFISGRKCNIRLQLRTWAFKDHAGCLQKGISIFKIVVSEMQRIPTNGTHGRHHVWPFSVKDALLFL